MDPFNKNPPAEVPMSAMPHYPQGQPGQGQQYYVQQAYPQQVCRSFLGCFRVLRMASSSVLHPSWLLSCV